MSQKTFIGNESKLSTMDVESYLRKMVELDDAKAFAFPLDDIYNAASKHKDQFDLTLLLRGEALTFNLLKSNVLPPNHLLGINGKTHRTEDVMGEVFVYKGIVNGKEGNNAFVFISKNYFRAYYKIGKTAWGLRSLSSNINDSSVFISFKDADKLQEEKISEGCAFERNKTRAPENTALCTISNT